MRPSGVATTELTHNDTLLRRTDAEERQHHTDETERRHRTQRYDEPQHGEGCTFDGREVKHRNVQRTRSTPSAR